MYLKMSPNAFGGRDRPSPPAFRPHAELEETVPVRLRQRPTTGNGILPDPDPNPNPTALPRTPSALRERGRNEKGRAGEKGMERGNKEEG